MVFCFAAAPLSDKRLQLWKIDQIRETDFSMSSCWKKDIDPNAAWTPWTEFPQPIVGRGARFITAAPLSDGRLQLWAISGGRLYSSWKKDVDPNAAWTPWTEFPQPGAFQYITAAPLPDGRLQLWGISEDKLYSSWKKDVDSHAQWTPWEQFPQPGAFQYITAAPLSDGRIQLWAVSVGNLYSTWKKDIDPNASWTPWTGFPQPGAFQYITAAPLSDGRIQLWSITGLGGTIYTSSKKDVDPNASWTPWTASDVPPLSPDYDQPLSAAPLSDKRLQLWTVTAGGGLMTSVQMSLDSSDWTPWKEFPR